MSGYKLTADELSARWAGRGEHPTYTRARHELALRGIQGRTDLPAEADYWEWVSAQTEYQFLMPERGLK